MKTVTGVFKSRADAERARAQLNAIGIPEQHSTLLTPESTQDELRSVPISASEQPGMGKAIGALAGVAAGMSAGPLIVAALVPGVGPITAIGLLGGTLLAVAAGGAGAVAGGKFENSMTTGLPEDELFIYEDALRQGKSVLVTPVEDEAKANRVRELLAVEGAETVDAARDQWWVGLRSAEEERYSANARNFGTDERFYRMGFEAALHARTRCKEYDQVMGEMNARLDELKAQYPGQEVDTAFTRGYARGRDYYQQICNERKAA